jgi:hypothetical protein
MFFVFSKLAEKNLMNDAIQKSEDLQIEKAMLDDKLKATDWEATNDEIIELVARESYLQWLKDNEKRQNSVCSFIRTALKKNTFLKQATEYVRF